MGKLEFFSHRFDPTNEGCLDHVDATVHDVVHRAIGSAPIRISAAGQPELRQRSMRGPLRQIQRSFAMEPVITRRAHSNHHRACVSRAGRCAWLTAATPPGGLLERSCCGPTSHKLGIWPTVLLLVPIIATRSIEGNGADDMLPSGAQLQNARASPPAAVSAT